MKNTKEGKLVIVSGPSGVGKSTICKELVKRLDNAQLNISITTRPKSQNEVNGRDYWFVSKKQFQMHLDEDSLLEYAEVFGHLYGTLKDKVNDALLADKTVILEIDVQGARQVKLIYPDATTIFILAPTQQDLAERINNRGREGTEAAKERLSGASGEIAAAQRCYQYMIINDNLEQTINKVIQIIS